MTAGGHAVSRTARQGLVASLLRSREVASQTDLTDLLSAQGIAVTQGTISKDLLELGAVRTRTASGAVVYALPDDDALRAGDAAQIKLARVCTELLVGADASANLAVAHTPPGAAQYFASALDRANWDEVIGTIAGDDTIMIISRDPAGGAAIAERLLVLANPTTKTDADQADRTDQAQPTHQVKPTHPVKPTHQVKKGRRS